MSTLFGDVKNLWVLLNDKVQTKYDRGVLLKSLQLQTPLPITSGGTGLNAVGSSGQVLTSDGSSMSFTDVPQDSRFAGISADDIGKIDGILNGTVRANRCVVVGANKEISTLGDVGCANITSSGNIICKSNIRIDGSATNSILGGSIQFSRPTNELLAQSDYQFKNEVAYNTSNRVFTIKRLYNQDVGQLSSKTFLQFGSYDTGNIDSGGDTIFENRLLSYTPLVLHGDTANEGGELRLLMSANATGTEDPTMYRIDAFGSSDNNGLLRIMDEAKVRLQLHTTDKSADDGHTWNFIGGKVSNVSHINTHVANTFTLNNSSNQFLLKDTTSFASGDILQVNSSNKIGKTTQSTLLSPLAASNGLLRSGNTFSMSSSPVINVSSLMAVSSTATCALRINAGASNTHDSKIQLYNNNVERAFIRYHTLYERLDLNSDTAIHLNAHNSDGVKIEETFIEVYKPIDMNANEIRFKANDANHYIKHIADSSGDGVEIAGFGANSTFSHAFFRLKSTSNNTTCLEQYRNKTEVYKQLNLRSKIQFVGSAGTDAGVLLEQYDSGNGLNVQGSTSGKLNSAQHGSALEWSDTVRINKPLNIADTSSLNDNELRLRGLNDPNHFLKWTNDESADGPLLHGHGGGLLRSQYGTHARWKRSGNDNRFESNHFSSYSDDRLKYGETPLVNALATVMTLNPVSYRKTNALGEPDAANLGTEWGFVAQSVFNGTVEMRHAVIFDKTLPENFEGGDVHGKCVTDIQHRSTTGDGIVTTGPQCASIQYDNFHAVSIKAIQELLIRIEALESTVQSQAMMIATLQ